MGLLLGFSSTHSFSPTGSLVFCIEVFMLRKGDGTLELGGTPAIEILGSDADRYIMGIPGGDCRSVGDLVGDAWKLTPFGCCTEIISLNDRHTEVRRTRDWIG